MGGGVTSSPIFRAVFDPAGITSSLFGSSQKEQPAAATYTPEDAPTETEKEAESTNVRDNEQRKIRARKLMGGTVLTSPLGTTGGVSSSGASLLGISGS